MCVAKHVASWAVATLSFDASFDEASAAAWCDAQGFAGVEVAKQAGGLCAHLRGEDEFVAGSLRTIAYQPGVTAVIGLPTLQKSAAAPAVEELSELYDLVVLEVTLTESPAVAGPAHFRLVKSLDAAPAVAIISKKDAAKKQVGGYVLVKDLPDLQGDVVSEDEVEKAAHSYLKALSLGSQKGSGAGLEHQVFDGIGHPIASFFDKTGVNGLEGGWWVEIQVTNEKVWKAIQAGKIKGFSIGGKAKSRPLEGALLKGGASVSENVKKGLSDNDIHQIKLRVTAALQEAEKGQPGYPWIERLYIDRVIYDRSASSPQLWMRTYVIADDDTVTLSEPTEVMRTYVAKALDSRGELLFKQPPKSKGGLGSAIAKFLGFGGQAPPEPEANDQPNPTQEVTVSDEKQAREAIAKAVADELATNKNTELHQLAGQLPAERCRVAEAITKRIGDLELAGQTRKSIGETVAEALDIEPAAVPAVLAAPTGAQLEGVAKALDLPHAELQALAEEDAKPANKTFGTDAEASTALFQAILGKLEQQNALSIQLQGDLNKALVEIETLKSAGSPPASNGLAAANAAPVPATAGQVPDGEAIDFSYLDGVVG